MTNNFFDEPSFRQRVVQAFDREENDAAAATKTRLTPPTISRIRSGKRRITQAETYFRLMAWMTGVVPPQ